MRNPVSFIFQISFGGIPLQGWSSNESSEFKAIRIYNQRIKPRRAALTNERTSVRSITIEFKVIRSYYQRTRPRRAAPTSERTSIRSISYRIKYIRVRPYSFDLFDGSGRVTCNTTAV